jgi:hypothetical protein
VTACSALQLRTALKGQQIGRKEMMLPFPFPFPTTTTTTSTHQPFHHAARPPLSPLLLHSHLSLAHACCYSPPRIIRGLASMEVDPIACSSTGVMRHSESRAVMERTTRGPKQVATMQACRLFHEQREGWGG